MFYKATVSNEQLDVLKKLSEISNVSDKFYLAGGTALSLRLGHRRSYDFDFFTYDKFDSDFYSNMIKIDFGGDVFSLSEDTVNGIVNIVGISFFRYQYKLIRETDNFYNINLASLIDLAAMKFSAIMKRGTKRDFFDIYEILKIFQLSELKNIILEKFGKNGNSFYHLTRSIFYFEDAEKDIDPISLNGTTWTMVKNYLLANEKKITKAFL